MLLLIISSAVLVAFAEGGCQEDLVNDQGFMNCMMGFARYGQSMYSDPTGICSEEGQAAMVCIYKYIKQCPGLLGGVTEEQLTVLCSAVGGVVPTESVSGEVDGNWTEWSDWSTCDVTCEDGSQSRQRTCTNPEPAHGGFNCTGDNVQQKTCTNDACPAYMPEIKASFERIKISVDQNVLLPCEIDGEPKPHIYWTLRGQKVEGPRFDMNPTGDLIITAARQMDGGVWTCIAENMYGTVHSSGELLVREKTIIVNPPQPNEQQKMFGSLVYYECVAVTDTNEISNLKISWLKDEKPLVYAPPRIYKDASSNSLVINGTRAIDTGVYTCVASNGLDSDRKSATLDVTGNCQENLLKDQGYMDCMMGFESFAQSVGSDPTFICREEVQTAMVCVYEYQKQCPEIMGGVISKEQISVMCSAATAEVLPPELSGRVDGNRTEWSDWSTCDVTCANGTQSRQRTCTNPVPAHGRLNCTGDNAQQKTCTNDACPGNCQEDLLKDQGFMDCMMGFSSFAQSVGSDPTFMCREEVQTAMVCVYEYQKQCPGIMGGLSKEQISVMCSAAAEGGFPPELSDRVDGNWTEWSDWSTCDVTCANGTHSRQRTCTNPVPAHGGLNCTGDNAQQKTCTNDACPGNCQEDLPRDQGFMDCMMGFSSFAQSVGSDPTFICREEVQTAMVCVYEYQKQCPEIMGGIISKEQMSVMCSAAAAGGFPPELSGRVDGNWTEWSDWSTCDVTCANGTHSRQRTCTNPVPAHGGLNCTGDNAQQKTCTNDACPGNCQKELLKDQGFMDCMMGFASFAQSLGADPTFICREEVQSAMVCVYEYQKQCPEIMGGISKEQMSVMCSALAAGVLPPELSGRAHSGWSTWDSWGACSVTCGVGMQRRNRTCTNPAPVRYGDHCFGDAHEDRICRSTACSDGTFSVYFASSQISHRLLFTSILLNDDQAYNPTTGIFTAPKTGLYTFSVQLCSKPNTYIRFAIIKESTYLTTSTHNDKDMYSCTSSNALARLNVGDRVYVYLYDAFSNLYQDTYSRCSFKGFFISA